MSKKNVKVDKRVAELAQYVFHISEDVTRALLSTIGAEQVEPVKTALKDYLTKRIVDHKTLKTLSDRIESIKTAEQMQLVSFF